MTAGDELTAAWRSLVRAETEMFRARTQFLGLLRDRADLSVLARALEVPHERGTALRCISCLRLDERQQLFPELMRSAAVAHADIALVRSVLASFPADWFEAHAAAALPGLLSDEDPEAYRRLAELFHTIAPGLLPALLVRAGESADEEIREVAEDFAP